jgi:hypothetical protein
VATPSDQRCDSLGYKNTMQHRKTFKKSRSASLNFSPAPSMAHEFTQGVDVGENFNRKQTDV